MLDKVFIYTLLCNTLIAGGVPQATSNEHNGIDNFQNAVQQQTFQSVLIAIEERLRNLDNVYSMQLSETIKSKLDQYHRKLESLDMKIIRLESLVMLNLNKISENISTKNYKDDVALTQVYRKLDGIYDGLSHRINYMDRKSDTSFEKLQNKIDTTLLRIEKMEENMMQRDSDIETELSETIFVIEDLKTSSENTEQSLLKITTVLNETVSNGLLMNSINLSMQNLIRNLNQSFTQRLEELGNTTLRSLNVSRDSNNLLKSMELELKADFNDYANKVADMNVDIWKRNDIADESLKIIETVGNSTRTEVQNGVRALILQIGKLSGKNIINNDKQSLESLKKNVNLSLEKIITNQELFLESCHRVQMDESQIESEISVMLGKLIDMLEKKMTTVMKDIKNLEKTVKNHDGRTTRNIYQANTNIVSLFEKTTKSSETIEKELQETKFYINSLFTLVQDVLPKSIGSNRVDQNVEIIFRDLSENITHLIKSTSDNSDIKWIQLEQNFTKHNDISENVREQITNIPGILLNIESDNYRILSNKIDSLSEQIGKIIFDNKKINSMSNTTPSENNLSNIDTSSKRNLIEGIKRTNCARDYSNLIDIRVDAANCNEDIENPELNNQETEPPPIFISNVTSRPQDDELLEKAILDIFGTPPPNNSLPTNVQNGENITEVTESKNKKKCIPAWANLLNVRADLNTNGEECTEDTLASKDSTDKAEDIFGSTEDSSNNESTTESDVSSPETTKT